MKEEYVKLMEIQKQIENLIKERNKIFKIVFKEAKKRKIIPYKSCFDIDNNDSEADVYLPTIHHNGSVCLRFHYPMFHKHRLDMDEHGEFIKIGESWLNIR